MTDYAGSYYGRLALARLDPATKAPLSARSTVAAAARPPGVGDDTEGEDILLESLPPNEPVVRALLGLGLYQQAISELQYAQRVWEDSPAVRATLA